MNIIFLFTGILFSFWVLRNILFWVYLWQLKEYRFDRVLIHLKDTNQGKALLFSPLGIIKWLLIFGYIFVILNNRLLIIYSMFVLLVYLLEFFIIMKELFLRLLKKPIFTLKGLSISLITFLIISLLFFLPLFDRFLWIIILDRFIPLLILIIIFFFSFPTEIYRDWKISRAIKKIRENKNLLVIGITGSYGKSSTKDYIAQVLEKKFKVLKTPGTNNTPIGIANIILSGLKKDTEIFIVEMGAYKKGEITEMCQMVNPKIGILTAINFQHLPLFGNIKNIIEAKYELIKNLPKNGTALLNGNNNNVLKLYKKTKIKKVLYYAFESLKEEEKFRKKINVNPEIIANNIQLKKTFFSFEIILNGKREIIKTRLIGSHQVQNILPAIYLANDLGIDMKEIKKAIYSLRPLSKTMIRKELTNGITIVDDTFNANPNAVLATVDYLKIYNGKKFLVLQPMIELGKSADGEHFRVAKEISGICDYLLLTNKNYLKEIMKGIRDGKGNCIVKTGNTHELTEFLIKNLKRNDVVVFEGKEAAFVLSKIESILK